jgi:hypothetical protein
LKSVKNSSIRKSSSSYPSCTKISLIHSCKLDFLEIEKITVYDHNEPIGAVFHHYQLKKIFFSRNLSIISDRDKNSASNDFIFNESYALINGFLGQKLIFPSIKSAQHVPYLPTNFEKNVIFVISTFYSIDL